MWIVVQGPREDLGRNKAWLLEGGRRQRPKELSQAGSLSGCGRADPKWGKQGRRGCLAGDRRKPTSCKDGQVWVEGRPQGGVTQGGGEGEGLGNASVSCLAHPVLGGQWRHAPRSGPAEGSPPFLKRRGPQEHWGWDLRPGMPEVGPALSQKP